MPSTAGSLQVSKFDTCSIGIWPGGRLSGFAEDPRSRTAEFLDTIRFNPWSAPREQYFIRLSSPEPLEQLWSEPAFEEVIARLVRLGLTAQP
jgi:hypothetical protein